MHNLFGWRLLFRRHTHIQTTHTHTYIRILTHRTSGYLGESLSCVLCTACMLYKPICFVPVLMQYSSPIPYIYMMNGTSMASIKYAREYSTRCDGIRSQIHTIFMIRVSIVQASFGLSAVFASADRHRTTRHLVQVLKLTASACAMHKSRALPCKTAHLGRNLLKANT